VEGGANKVENIIPYNMPVLLEKNTLETIWTRCLVRFHGIQGNSNLFFSNWA